MKYLVLRAVLDFVILNICKMYHLNKNIVVNIVKSLIMNEKEGKMYLSQILTYYA